MRLQSGRVLGSIVLIHWGDTAANDAVPFLRAIGAHLRRLISRLVRGDGEEERRGSWESAPPSGHAYLMKVSTDDLEHDDNVVVVG